MSDFVSSRRADAALFGAVLLVVLFFFSGRLESSDEILMALTSRSLATGLSLRFPETYGQTFTGYGVGQPALGVLSYLAESALRRAGVLVTPDVSLFPLVNGALTALIAVLAAALARWMGAGGTPSRAGAFLAVTGGALLPAANSFISDVSAAAGLLALVWALKTPSPRLGLAAAMLGGLLTVCARPAMVPFAGLVLVWGLWEGVARGRLVAGAAGAGVGVAIRLAQNAVLRGSPFDQGYAGQEFTTPVLTGLAGLLFAPERGLLLFAPVTALVLLRSWPGGSSAARFRALAAAVMVFSLIFHALFWTWHGGWTVGPRFLLPAIALTTPLIACHLAGWRGYSPRARLLTAGALAWGLWGAVLYSSFSAIDYWNRVWGFHRVESRWQFEPQLSLWANWEYLLHRGELKPFVLQFATGASGAPVAFAITVLAIGGSVLGFVVWRCRRCLPRPSRGALMAAGLVLAMGVCGALRGPRIAAGSIGPGERTAILDCRPHGDYQLFARVDGPFRILVNDRLLAGDEGNAPSGPMLLSVSFPVSESGPVLLETNGAVRDLFWTWPGEGRLLQPLGGEFVMPRDLTGMERGFTAIWRRRWLILGGLLALVLLYEGRSRRHLSQTVA